MALGKKSEYEKRFSGGGGSAPPPVDPTAARLADAIATGQAFEDDQGLIQYYDVVSGDWITFASDGQGGYRIYTPPEKGGGGADNTVGMANVGLGYANLGENARQFDASQAQDADQFNRSLEQGAREFDATYSRNAFESDRAYEEARYQYATSFAENQRQFDANYGLDTRSLDLQTEIGRGGLEVDRGRLALDDRLGTGRLALDTEIGRGRLALDDRLGTGYLANDTSRVGIERGRLALDDRLGTGRLALDTRLGEGGLRLDADRLGFDKQATDRSQRLDENKFRAEVLRNPSDYVFRAFESRGRQAPDARITQADVLNSIAGRYAQGGYGDDRLFLTGEQGPELVANHGDGTFSVADAPTTSRLMGGQQRMRPSRLGQTAEYAGSRMGGDPSIQPVASPGPRIGGADDRYAAIRNFDWEGLGARFRQWMQDRVRDGGNAGYDRPPAQSSRWDALRERASAFPWPSRETGGMGESDWVDRAGQWRQEWIDRASDEGYANAPQIREPRLRAQPMPDEVPGYASGTDDQFFAELDRLSGFQPAAIPTFNQGELVNAARKYSPPGVTDALAGRDPGTYRTASKGLTLRRLGRLTGSEQEALNTRLGVEFNTTLQDEIDGLRSRFGAVRTQPTARMAV